MGKIQRDQLLKFLAVLGVVVVSGFVMLAIWLNVHPDDMNQTFLGEQDWVKPWIIAGLVVVGAGLVVSLALNRKDYVTWRIAGVVLCFLGASVCYTWWYQVLPVVFGLALGPAFLGLSQFRGDERGATETSGMVKIGIFVVLVVVGAIVFTVDDVTGIGELLDPVEFVLMSVLGYAYPKFTGMGK